MKTANMKKIIGSLALGLALTLSASVGYAQDRANDTGKRGERGMRDGGGGFGHFGRELNLSEAQKTQMQQIAARFKQSTRSTHEQLRALHHNGGAGGFKDGAFNEATVRQAAQARANLEVELQVSRARMMSEMYAILTPEQKAQLQQKRQEREQQHKQRMQQRKAGGNAAGATTNNR